jgi:hypothetical protein
MIVILARLVAVLLFLTLCLPAIVRATTIVAVRTPTEIYVGVDSKVKIVTPEGAVSYEDRCKLVQLGNVFYTAAGPYRGRGLSIKSSLVESQVGGGTLYQVASRFAARYAKSIARTAVRMWHTSRAQYLTLATEPINVYFFGFDGDTPVLIQKRFIVDWFQPDDSVGVQILDYDCQTGCEEVTVVGIGHVDAMKGLASASETQSPIAIIRDRISSSIKSDPTNSGLPIDILHLTKAGAKWIQNEKKCPDIQPY